MTFLKVSLSGSFVMQHVCSDVCSDDSMLKGILGRGEGFMTSFSNVQFET